ESPQAPTLRPARLADPSVSPDIPSPPRAPEVSLGSTGPEEPAVSARASSPSSERTTDPVELGRPPEVPPRHLPTIGRFGPYNIVGRLALGGMAEILLAREDSPG